MPVVDPTTFFGEYVNAALKPVVDPTTFFGEYVNAALNYMSTDSCESFFFTFGINNITPDALRKMQTDCTSFLLATAPLLSQGSSVVGAGSNFFLTRNRSGTGYWDSIWPPDVAKQLTNIAQSFPEQHCLIQTDGTVSVYP
jgi:hypothetical protein